MILKPSREQFRNALDKIVNDYDLFISSLVGLNYDFEDVIKEINHLSQIELNEEEKFALYTLQEYFDGYLNQFEQIRKIVSTNSWKIEPHFEEFANYQKAEYEIQKITINELLEKYSLIVEQQIKKCYEIFKQNEEVSL